MDDSIKNVVGGFLTGIVLAAVLATFNLPIWLFIIIFLVASVIITGFVFYKPQRFKVNNIVVVKVKGSSYDGKTGIIKQIKMSTLPYGLKFDGLDYTVWFAADELRKQ